MEKNAKRMDKGRRRGGRSRRRDQADDHSALSRICVAVAKHYHLRPKDLAEFSGSQLLLWYNHIRVEVAEAKLLDLEVSLVPHTEHPDRALRNLRENLLRMTEGD